MFVKIPCFVVYAIVPVWSHCWIFRVIKSSFWVQESFGTNIETSNNFVNEGSTKQFLLFFTSKRPILKFVAFFFWDHVQCTKCFEVKLSKKSGFFVPNLARYKVVLPCLANLKRSLKDEKYESREFARALFFAAHEGNEKIVEKVTS